MLGGWIYLIKGTPTAFRSRRQPGTELAGLLPGANFRDRIFRILCVWHDNDLLVFRFFRDLSSISAQRSELSAHGGFISHHL